jgi:hypothetical protein
MSKSPEFHTHVAENIGSGNYFLQHHLIGLNSSMMCGEVVFWIPPISLSKKIKPTTEISDFWWKNPLKSGQGRTKDYVP